MLFRKLLVFSFFISSLFAVTQNVEQRDTTITGNNQPSKLDFGYYIPKFENRKVVLFNDVDVSKYKSKYLYVGYGVYDKEEKNCKYLDVKFNKDNFLDYFKDIKTTKNDTYAISKFKYTYKDAESLANKFSGTIADPKDNYENQLLLSQFYSKYDTWIGITKQHCADRYRNDLNVSYSFNNLVKKDFCREDKLFVYSKANSTLWENSNGEEKHYVIIHIHSPDYKRPVRVCSPWWRIERTYAQQIDKEDPDIKDTLSIFKYIHNPKQTLLCTKYNPKDSTKNKQTREVQCTTYYDISADPTCAYDLYQDICKVNNCKGYIENSCKLIDRVSGFKDYTFKWVKQEDGSLVKIKNKDKIVNNIYECPPEQPSANSCLQANKVLVYPAECPDSDCDSLINCIKRGDRTESQCLEQYKCEVTYGNVDNMDIDNDGNVVGLYGKCSDGKIIEAKVGKLQKITRTCLKYNITEETNETEKYCETDAEASIHKIKNDITSKDIYQNNPDCVRMNNIQEARKDDSLNLIIKNLGEFKVSIVYTFTKDNNNTTTNQIAYTKDNSFDTNNYINSGVGLIKGSRKVTNNVSSDDEVGLFPKEWFYKRIDAFKDTNLLGIVKANKSDAYLTCKNKSDTLLQSYCYETKGNNLFNVCPSGETYDKAHNVCRKRPIKDNRHYFIFRKKTISMKGSGSQNKIFYNTDSPNSAIYFTHIYHYHRSKSWSYSIYDLNNGGKLVHNSGRLRNSTLDIHFNQRDKFKLSFWSNKATRVWQHIVDCEDGFRFSSDKRYCLRIDPICKRGYTLNSNKTYCYAQAPKCEAGYTTDNNGHCIQKAIKLQNYKYLYVTSVEDNSLMENIKLGKILQSENDKYYNNFTNLEDLGISKDNSKKYYFYGSNEEIAPNQFAVWKRKDDLLVIDSKDIALTHTCKEYSKYLDNSKFDTTKGCVIEYPNNIDSNLTDFNAPSNIPLVIDLDDALVLKTNGYNSIFSIQSYIDNPLFTYFSTYTKKPLILGSMIEANTKKEVSPLFKMPYVKDRLTYVAHISQKTIRTKSSPPKDYEQFMQKSVWAEIFKNIPYYRNRIKNNTLFDEVIKNFMIYSGAQAVLDTVQYISNIFRGSKRFAEFHIDFKIYKTIPSTKFYKNKLLSPKRDVSKSGLNRYVLTYESQSYTTGITSPSKVNQKISEYNSYKNAILDLQGIPDTTIKSLTDDWEKGIRIGWRHCSLLGSCRNKTRYETKTIQKTIIKKVTTGYSGAVNQLMIYVPYLGDYVLEAFDAHNNKLATRTIYGKDFISSSGSFDYQKVNFAMASNFNIDYSIKDGKTTNACRVSSEVEWGGGVSGANYEIGTPLGFRCQKSNDAYVKEHSATKIAIKATNSNKWFYIKLIKPMPYPNRVVVVTASKLEDREYKCFKKKSCSIK